MQNNEENEQHGIANGHSWILRDLKKETLHEPILEELQSILTNRLMVAFEDVIVKITSCPCLMKKPFNLAATGLHGNTAIIECDAKSTTREVWNMKYYLMNFAYDSFLIGGGFGAKPYLPFNGYLIMNATFSQPEQINNASRLVFAKRINEPGRMEMIKEPDQMTCSATGNFFMSEGRPGRVLEIRAKKRKYFVDIITIIEDALNFYYGSQNKVVGLGGILLINKGKVLVSVIPNNIPENQIISSNDLTNWIECREINCTSTIIALGTIVGRKINFGEQKPCHFFYTFSENNVGGRFINDITPDETEYVGYFNLAKYLINI